LRHSHATLGLSAGIPAKVTSERLGHSKVGITVASTAMSCPACRRKPLRCSAP
jgi:integrase